jgi:autotransporter-associated beta strand protein
MASRNNTTPSILNVSGNNTITSNLSSGGGGSNITFQSDAGQLSLSGNLGVRNPNFAGAGNILASGSINSPTGYRSLTKSGSGTLILAGASNVTDNTTTISGGTLQIGNAGTSGSLGSAAVSNNASLAFDRTDSVTVSNAISGSGELIQRGTGTLEITGDSNTYTGGTTVSAGTLLVNNSTNSGLGTGQVTVNGGTLGGTGSFTGALVINTTGVLSPGASIASLDTGALTLNSGSTFDYELITTAVTGDLLNANGNLDLNGLVTLSLTDLGTNSVLSNGTKFTLISYFGSWTSGDIFSGYTDDSDFTLFGNEWRINYDDVSAGSVNGGAFSNAVTLTVIPEPAAALLGGLGLLSLLRRRR